MGFAQNIIGLTEYYCPLNESLGNTLVYQSLHSSDCILTFRDWCAEYSLINKLSLTFNLISLVSANMTGLSKLS